MTQFLEAEAAAQVPTDPGQADDQHPITQRQAGALALAVFVIAGCGMVYELCIATVSSYLLGNSVYQFSVTIGLFMAAMGAGAFLSKLFRKSLLEVFIGAEILLAAVGGVSSILLFAAFSPDKSLYAVTMYTLIAVVGSLVGIEIPIIVRFLAQHGGVRRGVADALSLDYLGGLLGCLAFPILMLPYLGLLRASFAVGLLNALVGLIIAIAFRKQLKRPNLWIGACLLVAAVLCVGFALDKHLRSYAEDGLYGGRIIHREPSPYQHIIVTQNPDTGEHRLYIDGHIQFAEFDEFRYHESLVHPVLAIDKPRENVLILGGGDGLAARETLTFDGVKSITLVDLDPAITKLANSFAPLVRLNKAALKDERVKVIHGDAFNFVQQSKESFDRVIIDLPDPHNEALSKLYSVEFYRMLHNRMPDGGAFSVQSSSPYFTPEVYWSIRQTIEAAGFGVISYHVQVPAFGVWGFHLALKNDDGGEDAKTAEPVFEWKDEAQYMSGPVFAAARVFPKDIQLQRPGVNSMFDPELYLLYIKGVQRGRPVVRK